MKFYEKYVAFLLNVSKMVVSQSVIYIVVCLDKALIFLLSQYRDSRFIQANRDKCIDVCSLSTAMADLPLEVEILFVRAM
jgi:hypothetical protein